jgi:hypothetical protein
MAELMSKRVKIASLIAFLAITSLVVIAFFTYDPNVVFSKDVGLILGVFLFPAVLAVSLVVFLHRLTSSHIERPPPSRGHHNDCD